MFVDDELIVTSTAGDVHSSLFRVEHLVERAGEQVVTGFEVRVVARPGNGARLERSPMPDELRSWLLGDGP